MAESNQKNPPGRPKKNHWTSERLSEMELDQIFSEIPREYMVKVHRKEPEWAAGYLGTIHFDVEEPFSVDELQARFGGSLFTLKIVDEQHKYRGSKTVRIADVPRKDYQEMQPDYLTLDGAQRRQSMRGGGDKQNNAVMGMGFNMPPGLPPEMQRKLMQWFILGDKEEKKGNSTSELMQQKLMMDMMQAQSNHQMAMQKHQLDYERELQKLRRGSQNNEPLGEVQQTIALLRELNGIKTEFGGSEHPATEIIAQTAPILETALTEIIALQKLKAQSEIARVKGHQQPSARPLPRRAPPARQTVQNSTQGGHHMSTPKDTPTNGRNHQPDIVELSRQMGQAFRGLTDEQQQRCLSAFMGGQENSFSEDYEIDETSLNGNNNSDTVTFAAPNPDMLDPEDQAVLESASEDEESTNSEDEPENVSDVEHAGATQADTSIDGSSNNGGGGLSPN